MSPCWDNTSLPRNGFGGARRDREAGKPRHTGDCQCVPTPGGRSGAGGVSSFSRFPGSVSHLTNSMAMRQVLCLPALPCLTPLLTSFPPSCSNPAPKCRGSPSSSELCSREVGCERSRSWRGACRWRGGFGGDLPQLHANAHGKALLSSSCLWCC